MTKLTIALAAIAFAAPPTSSAAGRAAWLSDPTCSATPTALTCTGKGAGLRPYIYPISGSEAAISGEVRYTCTEPFLQSTFFGFPTVGPLSVRYLASADFENGKTFSVRFSPPAAPPARPFDPCLPGGWTRDPNYYNVRVVAGWGFGSATPIEALEAIVSTVSPG